MRSFADRLRTAQVIPSPIEFDAVAFGHQVTFKRDDGRRQAFRIVEEDEADPRKDQFLTSLPSRGPGSAELRTM
jgi:transcription elongation GreA/GreB family factor